jgi:hypothetical protein
MSKKQAHIVLFFGDLLSLGAIIMFYYDFNEISIEISSQVEVISFSNRMGFFVLGVGLPIIHILGIVEYFWPEFIKNNHKILNISVIVVLVVLLAAGFAGSAWIKSKVENAGYVYCRKASGASALAKALVYTKNIEICEELVKPKKKKSLYRELP